MVAMDVVAAGWADWLARFGRLAVLLPSEESSK